MPRASKTEDTDKDVKTQGKGVKKGGKDPNAPKRPMSAYFLWMGDNRQRIRDGNPEAKITEVSKIGGAEWTNLQDKTKWEKQAKAAKAQYEKDLEAYKKTKEED